MALIGPFLCILGLAVASVKANDKPVIHEIPVTMENITVPFTTASPNSTTSISSVTSLPMTTSNMTTTNMTTSNMTTTNMTTTDYNSSMTYSPSMTTDGKSANTSSMSVTTPKPIGPIKSTTAIYDPITPKPKPRQSAISSTGIIILVLIIIMAAVFGVACLLTRKRGRDRYSLDLTSRPDESNIPLSAVEPMSPGDTAPHNGLHTFESPEMSTKEPQEPEAKPDVQEEQKAEVDKLLVDASTESAVLEPPESPEDKGKDSTAEASPPAPVEPSVEEKTDDEGAVSNKTSVESLKEANNNNSNNADLDLKWSNTFWDVPLRSPV